MIRNYQFYLTDAFTDQAFGGNPAGLVLIKDPIKDIEMQKIASEVKQSETAFIYRLDKEIYQVRFFTPLEEVDLCGHATIAAFWTKAKNGYIDPIEKGRKTINQYTKAGILPVYLDYEDYEIKKVVMAQPRAEFFGTFTRLEDLAMALGISKDDLGIDGYDLEFPIVSTGIKDLMIPVKNRDVLASIEADFEAMKDLSKEEGFYSYHVYTTENYFKEVYQRNFCPILGINEESATGTSTGALLAYLDGKNLLDQRKILAYQGIEMGRASQIYGSIEEIEGKDTILVGGQARILVEGVIDL